MKLDLEDRDGVRIAEVSGELDTFAAQSFRESLGLDPARRTATS